MYFAISNVKTASTVFNGIRLYFRLIPMSELSKLFIGTIIVTFTPRFTKFPVGILIDISKRDIVIRSPDNGQILCLNKDECQGFTMLKTFIQDIENEDLQQHPDKYTDNFIPPEELDNHEK